MIRQGDILLVPVPGLPDGAEEEETNPKEGIIVAAGEATGHHHRIRSPHVKAYRKGKQRFIHVPEKKKATWTHEEHDTLTVPPGVHQIVNQREYAPPKESDPSFRVRTVRVYD